MPRVQVNGIKIFYETFGEGEPLLFIMGLAMDHTGWKKQIEFFKDRFKVIVFDNRGSGASDKPITPYTTGVLARDAAGLLEHLNIPSANVVGVSMGGMIAQELAINYSAKVKKLIIVNSYSSPLPSIKEFVRTNFSPHIINKAKEESLVDYFLSLVLSEEFVKANPDVVSDMKKDYRRKISKLGLVNQLVATQVHNTSARLILVDVPTLVLYGEKDRVIPPECSKTLHEEISGSRLECIQGGSHAVNWEKAEEFNEAVMNFLGR